MNVSWLDSLRLSRRRDLIARGWASTSRPGIRFIDVGNATLRIREVGARTGDAPTVIMVCDPPNVVEHFDKLADAAASHMRLIFVEPPGFGFSCPAASFRFTFNEYVASFSRLLEVLGADRYLLAFPCIWSHLALELSKADHPSHICRLLLWQSPCWSQHVSWAKLVGDHSMLGIPVIGQFVSAWGAEKIAHTWYRAALAKGNSPRLKPCFQEAHRHGAFHCLGSVWQQWFYSGFIPSEHLVETPALVAWGQADRTHRQSEPYSVTQRLNNYETYRFDSLGHSPELENPEAFFEILLPWVTATVQTK